MSKLTDRISYLKGLAAGLKINTDKDANKLMLEMLSAMGEIADEMQNLTQAIGDLNEYVESIDDDLADLEETLFGEDDVHDEDCDCEDCADNDADEDDEDDVDGSEDELISYACPHCGHEIEFRASDVDFEEDYLCPACSKPIFPEVDE